MLSIAWVGAANTHPNFAGVSSKLLKRVRESQLRVRSHLAPTVSTVTEPTSGVAGKVCIAERRDG